MESLTYSAFLGFITSTTIIGQIYLLYLIWFHSPKSMAEYRYFLTTFTVFDMLFTVIIGIVFIPYSIPMIFAAFPVGPAKYFPASIQLFSMNLGFYAGAMVIQSELYSMIYRASTLCSQSRTHKMFMSKWSKIGFFIAQQIIGITTATLAYFACVKPNEFQQRVEIGPIYAQQAYRKYGFFIWFDVDKNPMCLIFFGVLVSGFVIAEILCALLIYFIMSTMRRDSDKFSASTFRLYRQLTIVLIVQVASPIFYIILPVSACIISVIVFRLDFGSFVVQLGFCLIDLYALSNTVFTLLLISPYRAHLLELIHFKRLQPILMKLGISSATNTQVHPINTTNPSRIHSIFYSRYPQQPVISPNIPN